jgi:hypothetical protein
LRLDAASAGVILNAPTRAQADALLGPGGADRVADALRRAFAAYLVNFFPIKLPILPQTVRPGVDSHDPLQISAPPSAAWIDATTLGVFGYYRAAATGGDVQQKHRSDLGSSHEEFFDAEPGLFPVVSGRRVVLVISADTFPMVIGCRAVRDGVVRELVRRREEDAWTGWIQGRYHDLLVEQGSYENLQRYYTEELVKDPAADQATLLERAMARIEADVGKELKRRRETEEDQWLSSTVGSGPATAGGQQTIDVAVPPPCGQGAVEVERVQTALTQSDVVPMLRHFDVRLGQGRVIAHYQVDGLVELITGDLTFFADGQMDVFLKVTETGDVLSSYKTQPPGVMFDGSGWTKMLKEFVQSLFEATGSWHALIGREPEGLVPKDGLACSPGYDSVFTASGRNPNRSGIARPGGSDQSTRPLERVQPRTVRERESRIEKPQHEAESRKGPGPRPDRVGLPGGHL